MTHPNLILASSSIYRRELLEHLQIPFSVISPDVDETPLPDERPEETALRLAKEKARKIAKTHQDALIIGCDQVATLDDVLAALRFLVRRDVEIAPTQQRTDARDQQAL